MLRDATASQRISPASAGVEGATHTDDATYRGSVGASSSEEEVKPQEVISTREIKEVPGMWEVSSFIEKKHQKRFQLVVLQHFLMTLVELISVTF